MRDALLLHFRRVFETTVSDSLKKFWFEKEVFEASAVDTCELELFFPTISDKLEFRLKMSVRLG